MSDNVTCIYTKVPETKFAYIAMCGGDHQKGGFYKDHVESCEKCSARFDNLNPSVVIDILKTSISNTFK